MDVSQQVVLLEKMRVACPIVGLNIWQPRIDFAPEATAEQRSAAWAIFDSFDPAAPENQPAAPRDFAKELDALKAENAALKAAAAEMKRSAER